MQKKYIVEYDYVRAIATLLVILGHCTYYAIRTDYGGIDLGVESICFTRKFLDFLTTTIYSFHMPLFIGLSGCLWARKDIQTLSFKDLVSNKFQHLIMPFFLTAIFLSIPFKLISGYWEGESCDEIILDIISGQLLFLGNANSHLWFLQALFLIFIIAYCIEKFNFRRSKKIFLITILFISILGRYTIANGYNFRNVPNAMLYFFWFYVGFYFEKNRERINSFMRLNLNGWKTIIMLLIMQVILTYLNSKLPYSITYLTYYILAISGMFSTYVICYKLMLIKDSFISKGIKTISKDSYDLYLFSDPYNYLFIFIMGLLPNYEMVLSDNIFVLVVYLLRFLFSTFGAILIIKVIGILPKYYSTRRPS